MLMLGVGRFAPKCWVKCWVMARAEGGRKALKLMLAASQHDRSTKLDAKLDAIVVTAGGITATPTFLLMLRGEGPEGPG